MILSPLNSPDESKGIITQKYNPSQHEISSHHHHPVKILSRGIDYICIAWSSDTRSSMSPSSPLEKSDVISYCNGKNQKNKKDYNDNVNYEIVWSKIEKNKNSISHQQHRRHHKNNNQNDMEEEEYFDRNFTAISSVPSFLITNLEADSKYSIRVSLRFV